MKMLKAFVFSLLIVPLFALNAYASEANGQEQFGETAALQEECNHEWSYWITEEEPTCQYEGLEYRYCYKCWIEETRPILRTTHYWSSWESDKKATKFASGKKHRYCEVCETIERAIIPQKEITATDRKVVKSAKRFFKLLKNYNYKKMGPVYYSKTNDFVKKNPFLSTYKKQFKKKLSYKILDVNTGTNSGSIKIKLTTPYAYSRYYSAYESYYYWYIGKYFRTGSKVSKASAESYVTKKMINAIKGNRMYKSTTTLTIKVKKIQGKWKLVSNSSLRDRLDGGMTRAFRDFKNEYS